MFSKVLKYDLKFAYKNLGIYCLIALAACLLAHFVPQINSAPFFQIVGSICQNVTLSMAVAIIINGLMRLWVNFRLKLYGDPAYLTHTLPIKRSTIYGSKVVAAAIVTLTNLIVCIATIFVAYGIANDFSIISDKLAPFVGTSGVAIWLAFSLLFLTIYMEFFLLAILGYTVTIAAYNSGVKNNKRALLTAFSCYLGTQALVVLSLYLAALVDPQVMVLFKGGQLDNLITPVCIALSINTLSAAVFGVLNYRLIRRRLNVA